VTLIDDRGRIFGGLNAVDAAAAAVIVAIVAFTYAGYRVFRLPPPPEVTAVTPATVQQGPALRLRLTGNHFLPFMRVFIRRSDGSTLVHDPAVFKPVDEYTLVNTTLAPWAVESPTLAQVQLPDDLGPGVYDLMFFNETRQVAIHRAAFTIAPRPATAPMPAPKATPLHVDAAQVSVRFVCRPAVAALIKVGDAEGGVAASGSPKSAVIASIGARRDGTSRSTVSDAGRWLTVDEPVVTLDVVLTVPVTTVDGSWMYRDAAVKAGATLGFETSSYTLRGWILNVSVSRPRSAE
jgi:uncharacterized protein DUF4330